LKNILHVIDSLAIGGAERMLVDLANTIDPNQFNISVCITRKDTSLLQEIRPERKICVLDRKGRWDLNGFKKLREFSTDQDIDLFHAHGRSSYSFLLAARELGFISKRILLHDHSGNFETERATPFWFKHFGAKRLDFHVGVSDQSSDWARKASVPINKLAIVNNAVDIQRYSNYDKLNLHEKLGIPRIKKIGVCVGNLRSAKGLDLLIDSVQKILIHSQAIFVIVGSNTDTIYLEQCKQRLKSTGLEESFLFVGQQYDSISWIKGADFAVLPSRSESGPLVLIEYMICGVPFVAFNVGEISKMVEIKFPENFAKPEDTNSFSEKIKRLIESDSERIQETVKDIQTYAIEQFDIQNKLPVWYGIYNNLLAHDK